MKTARQIYRNIQTYELACSKRSFSDIKQTLKREGGRGVSTRKVKKGWAVRWNGVGVEGGGGS